MPGLGLPRYRELGLKAGLAAGLAAVLDGLDPAAAAPQRIAVLPTVDVPRGVHVLPHTLAARDGLTVVRFPPSGGADGRGLTGTRAAALAAVRLGVLTALLDAAVERLARRRFGRVALLEQQLVIGALADVVIELEVSAATLYDEDTPAEVAAAHHERVTGAGWTVVRFFGAEGYVSDHPVRSLYVSTLVADIWVSRPAATPREE